MELEAQRTDQAIIEAVLGGDPEAYSLLAERYSARLFGLAFHLCGDYDSASDLVQETLVAAYGNLGPSLLHWGKIRGQSEPNIKYTYEKIYNAKAFNACSAMPRLGHKILSPKQVSDLVAYLVSPDSPINK